VKQTKSKIPDHCNGCPSYTASGVADGIHNRWCCHFGKPAIEAVGHCENVGGKEEVLRNKEKRESYRNLK